MFSAKIFITVTLVIVGCGQTFAHSNYYLPPPVLEDAPCAWTKQGRVCGDVIQTRDGRSVASYKGIPYAKPPVGELRFQEPVVADAWEGVLNATKDPPMCIQKNYLYENPAVSGQEDCLYLNVYTPMVKGANAHARSQYPVMFYIHGGGWFSGAGTSDLHGPQYLLDEEIILVTINYRLGVMGFFSTNDDASPGNWALKDMTLALQWVKDNIDSFGGNPESVTIFGQSAGAGSVHHLMLSPRTKGLFHKVIAQSGSALNLWAVPVNPIQIAQAQALFVGCPSNGTSEEIVECLRKVDATELVDSSDKFKVWSIEPITVYIPAIEKKTLKNPNPLVVDYPLNIIKQGKFHSVPFMMGCMANEGILRAAPIVTQQKLREDWNNGWDQLAPQLMALHLSTTNQSIIPELWNNITQFYMKGEKFINSNDSQSIQNFINLYSDRSFMYGMYQSALKHANQGSHPVYFYKIDFAGRDTWSDLFAAGGSPVNFVFNKCHCDDLNYLFRIPLLFPEPFPKDSLDTEMSKKLVRMWTNFAITGKPAKFWNKVSEKTTKLNYLEIESPVKMSMKPDFLSDRMNFWQQLPLIENS